MKKHVSLLMALMLLLSLFSAAGRAETPLRIVCTTFPQYDWTRCILGDRANDVELVLLLGNGIDLHNYQPTADDIIKIARSDLFVYVGGESDKWVGDVLQAAQNPNRRVISMLETVVAKEEETVEGMQAEAHNHDEDEAHDHEAEYDEHVWLSLRNAEAITRVLADALCELDPQHAELYRANASAYIDQLAALDARYSDMVHSADRTTILFADRFPFRYLADDYGLTYYAAFNGCSAETEASFQTIAFLAKKVDELHLPVVLTIEGDNPSIAETVIASTQTREQTILSMNSLQAVTEAEVARGESYLGVMTRNLETLTQALN